MFPNVADLIHFSLAAFKQRKTQKKKFKRYIKEVIQHAFLIEDFIKVRKLAIFVKITSVKLYSSIYFSLKTKFY